MISTSFSCLSQWQLVERIELTKAPQTLATDVQGYLYIGFKDGSLVKYDQSGEEILNYSLSNQSPITLIEPQFQLRTFLFYFDNQVITILDRFNGVPKNYSVGEFASGITSLACPAPDGSFWLIENNPAVLKKVDPNRKSVILETQPNIGAEIRFMKAHQNVLLVLDEKHLHIFDQFATLLYQIDVEADFLHVSRDVAYLRTNDSILEIDPFSGELLDKSPVLDTASMDLSSVRFSMLDGNEILVYQKKK